MSDIIREPDQTVLDGVTVVRNQLFGVLILSIGDDYLGQVEEQVDGTYRLTTAQGEISNYWTLAGAVAASR